MKPEFLKKLDDIEVKELETAVLEVEITSPSADVTWHKVRLIREFSFVKFENDSPEQVLKIYKPKFKKI